MAFGHTPPCEHCTAMSRTRFGPLGTWKWKMFPISVRPTKRLSAKWIVRETHLIVMERWYAVIIVVRTRIAFSLIRFSFAPFDGRRSAVRSVYSRRGHVSNTYTYLVQVLNNITLSLLMRPALRSNGIRRSGGVKPRKPLVTVVRH